MASFFQLLKRNYYVAFPPLAAKSDKPLKFGILGAARIAPIALIPSARSHPDVVIYAVAARDKAKAQKFAKKYGIEKAFGSYQELLDDPEVDAVYNPLPNGLHYEWTMKALAAGKHVLLEKPSANTAEESRAMFALAERMGLVLLEALHYRFHPGIQRAKAVLDSGELGAIQSITATLEMPGGLGIVKPDDIRFQFALGGGALMDLGIYTISCIRFLTDGTLTEVLHADPTLCATDALVDHAISASFALAIPGAGAGADPVLASIKCDLAPAPWLGFVPTLPGWTVTVRCARGELAMTNYVAPFLWHAIRVAPQGQSVRTEKAYVFDGKDGGAGAGVGEEWWTTYRHQLEAFVDQVRGRAPRSWVDADDSVTSMELIEEIYKKTGLGVRPASTYTPAA